MYSSSKLKLYLKGPILLCMRLAPLGAAGTGKSLLLRHIIRRLPPESTFVTASTGLAAAALGGTTLNAFAGVGRADGGREAMRRAASRPQAAGRWRRAAVLIVDEVRVFRAWV